MNEKLKKDVLLVLIRHAVDSMPGVEVVPSTYISRLLKQPILHVRYALADLVKEGLVAVGHDGGWNEWAERPFCIRGYHITNKARALPEYEEAQRQEEELIQQIWFGGNING